MGIQKHKGYNLRTNHAKRNHKQTKEEKLEKNRNATLNDSILKETEIGPPIHQLTNLPCSVKNRFRATQGVSKTTINLIK